MEGTLAGMSQQSDYLEDLCDTAVGRNAWARYRRNVVNNFLRENPDHNIGIAVREVCGPPQALGEAHGQQVHT